MTDAEQRAVKTLLRDLHRATQSNRQLQAALKDFLAGVYAGSIIAPKSVDSGNFAALLDKSRIAVATAKVSA